jgi:hypothetical protein
MGVRSAAGKAAEPAPSKCKAAYRRCPARTVLRVSVLLDSHPLALGIALASREPDRQRALDLCELGVGQIDLRRRSALLEMVNGACAWDRHDMRRFGKRPGDGQGRGLEAP